MKNTKLIIGKLALLMILALTTYNCADSTCEYEEPEEDTDFPFSCEAGMDVAFLIDYTGSMGGAINGIKSSVTSIAAAVVSNSGGDYRLSLSIFDEVIEGSTPGYIAQTEYTSLPAAQKKTITSGATRHQYLTMMEPFSTANTTSFGTQLAKLNTPMLLGSGVGYPEPGALLLDELLNNAFAGTWRTTNITKLAIIITDAPAGGDDDTADGVDDTYLASLAATANSMGVQCILITTMAAGTSNYEISLIDNNTDGVKLTGADFTDISTDIITLIEDICVNNEEG